MESFWGSMLVFRGVEESPVCVDVTISGSQPSYMLLLMGKKATKTFEFAHHAMSMIWYFLGQEQVFDQKTQLHISRCFFLSNLLGRCSMFQQYSPEN